MLLLMMGAEFYQFGGVMMTCVGFLAVIYLIMQGVLSKATSTGQLKCIKVLLPVRKGLFCLFVLLDKTVMSEVCLCTQCTPQRERERTREL